VIGASSQRKAWRRVKEKAWAEGGGRGKECHLRDKQKNLVYIQRLKELRDLKVRSRTVGKRTDQKIAQVMKKMDLLRKVKNGPIGTISSRRVLE